MGAKKLHGQGCAVATASPGDEEPQHDKKETGEMDEQHLEFILAKVSRVVLPLVFLLGIFSYLDKSSLAYASASISKQLQLTAVEYGIGSGLFSLGFGIGVIPSSYMTIRYGARFWLGFISIGWGAISVAHACMASHSGFYVLRFLLGLFEAGASSGAGHMLAQFYPHERRAKALTVSVSSLVISSIIGSPLAAALLRTNPEQTGLQGWQLMFIVEGAPSVAVGILLMVLLPSEPLTAWMLTPEERELLHKRVHGSAEAAAAARQPLPVKALLVVLWDCASRPLLWFFITIAFLWVVVTHGLSQWLPIIVGNMLSTPASDQLTLASSTAEPALTTSLSPAGTSSASHVTSGSNHSGAATIDELAGDHTTKAILFAGIPALTGVVAMWVVAWHADRVNERTLHMAVPYLLGGLLLAGYSPMFGLSFGASFAVLVVAFTLAYSGHSVMVTRVIGCLDTLHVGIGLSVFNAVVTCVGGFTGPLLISALLQQLGSFAGAMGVLGGLLATAGLLGVGLGAVEWHRHAEADGKMLRRMSSGSSLKPVSGSYLGGSSDLTAMPAVHNSAGLRPAALVDVEQGLSRSCCSTAHIGQHSGQQLTMSKDPDT